MNRMNLSFIFDYVRFSFFCLISFYFASFSSLLLLLLLPASQSASLLVLLSARYFSITFRAEPVFGISCVEML